MSRTVWMLCLLGVLAGSSPALGQEFRFETDWLYLSQDSWSDASFINGPDAFSADDADNDFESGYRFTLGGSSERFDFEAVFSQVDDWGSPTTENLGRLLILDDTAGNPIVVPMPPVNTLTFPNAIFDAATTAAVGNDETTESERINAGATASYQTSSDLKSIEFNFGTNRTANAWSFGIGYSQVHYNDTSNLLIRGTFDAIDVDPALPLDPNDGLAHLSLIGAGLQRVAGGADGFDAAAVPLAGPDILAMSFIGDGENELKGAQAIIGGRFYPGEWLTVESVTKLGLYHNDVRGIYQETYIGSGQDDSIYQRVLSDDGSVASFIGSSLLRGIIPLTDYISFMAGYEIMLLSNVALGSDQSDGIDRTLLGATTYSADASGDVFIHGLQFGVEVVW